MTSMSSGDSNANGPTAYRRARAVARHLGVGRLRDRIRASVHKSAYWTAVPPRRLKDLDSHGELPANAFALTFDDGPDPVVTPRLLEVLAAHSAPATFFLCGLAAKRHPAVVKDILAAGHAIGGHTWDHRHPMVRGLSVAEWQRQVGDTHKVLEDISGAPVRWFRPPRGITDRHTWSALRRQGLTTVLWSVDGRDCTLRDPDSVANGVLDWLGPGDIVLLHDANAGFLFAATRPDYGQVGNQESTVEATGQILRVAADRALLPVTLTMLHDATMPRSGRLRIPHLAGAK
jgi:peptidoglycan/xylan/chitin deacetylase (PgdA/CDA1 family)